MFARLTRSARFIPLLVLLVPCVAQASTYGGQASILVPEKKAPVQLRELTLHMALPSKTGRWQVEARYVLHNRGAKDYTLGLLLPELHCNSDKRTCTSPTAGHFHNLKTTVAGVEAKPKLHAEGAPKPGRQWRFEIPVKGKKRVEVVQRYELEPTTDREGVNVFVGMGESTLWHGPIVKAHVEVAVAGRPWTVGYPGHFALQRYSADIPTEGVMKGLATTHLSFKMRRWRIQEPLELHLATAEEVSAAHRCPDVRAVSDADKNKQSAAALKRILVMRSDKELDRCRKLFLALYGFPFSQKADRARFYGNAVKSASAVNTVLEGDRKYLRFGLRLNPTYTAELHPKAHKAYMDGLARELRRRQKK